MQPIQIIFFISAGLVVYSYLVYPLIVGVLYLLKRKKDMPQKRMRWPAVSIIIAAYNEEELIRERIENCLSLDYPEGMLEIVIASDGSTDHTNKIVREYQDHGVRLLGFKTRRGKVNVLNDAIKHSLHPIVIMSDANTMFKADAAKKLVRHFQDPAVGCVCGALHFVNAKGSHSGELEGIYWRYENFLKKMEGAWGSLLGANGAIYAISKDLFEPCPPDTIVEDFVIPMRILERGFRVEYEPLAIAKEETTKHIIQEKERRIRIGAGDFQALGLLWRILNPLRGFPAFAFWSHKVLRWFAPFFLIAAFLSNLILVNEPGFAFLFLGQSTFYTAALIGQALSWSGIKNKFFNLCYYFVSMNLALLLGFVKFLTNSQKVTWARTER